MNRTYRICLAFLALIALNILLLSSTEGASPNVTLKAVMSPEIRTIRIGEVPEVILTTRAEGQNLQFQWKLDGHGKFKGDDRTKPFIVYIPPDSIEGESEEVTIIVTVTDEDGRKSEDSKTFTLISQKTTAVPVLPTPTPLPTQVRKILLKEKGGQYIPPTYFVKPSSLVIITVDTTNPSNPDVRIEHDAVFGIVEWHQQELIYIAPKASGTSDIVTVTIIDQETSLEMDSEVFRIKISDNP